MSLKSDYKELEKLSPLEQRQRVQDITKKETGFGYDNVDEILQDLYDEIDELKSEIKLNNENNSNYLSICNGIVCLQLLVTNRKPHRTYGRPL